MSSIGRIIALIAGLVLLAVLLFFLVTSVWKSPAPQPAPAGSKSGTASTAMYTDVLDNTHGFIIEGAVLADPAAPGAVKFYGIAPIAEGKGTLVAIKGSGRDASTKSLLLLQIPAFAEGSTVEFAGDAKSGRFYVVSTKGGSESVTEGGLISGSIRFADRSASTTSIPGFMGELKEGKGDIEVVVSNINAGGGSIEPSRKYAARYSLPLVPFKQAGSITISL